MKKLEIYNKMKQAQYRADIESLRFRIWALEADDERDRADFSRIAERESSEAMGIFKACHSLLGDYNGMMNEETHTLWKKYRNKLEQYQKLSEEVA
jgi:hypothetical protein